MPSHQKFPGPISRSPSFGQGRVARRSYIKKLRHCHLSTVFFYRLPFLQPALEHQGKKFIQSWAVPPAVHVSFTEAEVLSPQHVLKRQRGSASLNQRTPAVKPFVDFYIFIHHGVQIIFLSGFSHDPLDLFFLNIQRHSAKLHTF